MSHAIRGLEEDIGVRLLSRTTRSVAPTEAGEQLLARLRPAVTEVQEALDQLSGLRNKPAGRLRLLLPRLAGTELLGPKLAQFTRDYPDVVLDITADDTHLDIVAGGYDAGIPVRRIYSKGHDRGARLQGPSRSHRRFTRVFQVASEAESSARPAQP
jgi:DNA-binding transcriptional LysR family regulator